MSDIVIQVEGLGKKYRIRHQQRERYRALRDVISERIGGMFRERRRDGSASSMVEDFWALADVSFQVRRGEVLGIIGRNGAGKSTLLKIMSRITEPTTGRAIIEGRIASLLEVGTGFHPELTGRENIYLNGAILGMRRSEIRRKFDEIVAFAEIEKFLDTPVKRYSSGMYVRLAFAVAAHLEPEILIVDEVLAVGDSRFQKKCIGKLGEVARGGRTVLFVSHQMATVENLCQTGLLLEQGRRKVMGDAKEVIAAYAEASAASDQQALRTVTNRRGNGAVRFVAFQIIDERAARVRGMACGRMATFEVHLSNTCEHSVRNVHISVGVDSAIGQRVTTWSTSYVGGDFPEIPQGDFVVRIRLPRVALIPGAYSFNLFATVNADIADWVIRAGSFDVDAGDYYGSGQVPSQNDGAFLSEHSFELESLRAVSVTDVSQ
jgi:lipopolysaccharide transport system ATP-binding protein